MLHHRKFADGRTLKIFAVITMFIDHVTCCFLEVARGADGRSIMSSFPGGEILDMIGRGIGRSAFPIFCFMLVEGFLYTHSRGKYFVRLLLFAAVSYFPFKWIFFPYTSRPHTDVIFTLALGFLLMWGIESMAARLLTSAHNILARRILAVIPERKTIPPGKVISQEKTTFRGETIPPGKTVTKYGTRDQKAGPEQDDPAGFEAEAARSCSGRGILRTCLFLAGSVLLLASVCLTAEWTRSDYSYGGVLVILLMYLLYRYRPASLAGAYIWLSVYNSSEILSVPGFWMIWCYNGSRGKQNKYFFYIFYPAHLLILYLIRRMIFGR